MLCVPEVSCVGTLRLPMSRRNRGGISRVKFDRLPDTDKLKAEQIPLEAQVLSGPPLMEYLRKNQKLFEVGSTPTPGFKYKLMDLKFIDQNSNPVVVNDKNGSSDIPESFDARKEWSNCSSVFHIRDQANCGSCWAVSSASAMSDRVCITSKGAKQVLISDQDIVSCCTWCGYGCQGGWSLRAWYYFAEQGVVTGGNYNTKGSCRPYEIHPCGFHKDEPYYGECDDLADTPRCKRRCLLGYAKSYPSDKHYGKTAYQLPMSVEAIQREIMRNGPVVAGFTVYEDFAYYTGGVYRHKAGKKTGGHAVKVIGWGVERKEGESIPYWLVANSWHNDWGENGYFRIIRGINDCGFEERMVAGLVQEQPDEETEQAEFRGTESLQKPKKP
ncbi:papain family cysteine protease [Teladorsagia circumcincta]|uniref:Papain family cysteine protease n=1 Tax=Teladorsagia circumcincta TaxID=45464 RepID=A0A2G9UL99_TELCI|nr:papain family cysteine protease [Teladorsagia circumcincta]